MSGSCAYLDSSAFVKLVCDEPSSAALRHHLAEGWVPIASTLLATEVLRAAQRVSTAHLDLAREMLLGIDLIELERPLLDAAGALRPPELRSLYAIHLAAALSLGEDLGEFVSYDRRLLQAARAQGLRTISPA
ncbi:MAG: type II toxin-antitoxin system VapC family toxin [Candidatus Dormiibacterota bacterium]